MIDKAKALEDFSSARLELFSSTVPDTHLSRTEGPPKTPQYRNTAISMVQGTSKQAS